MIWAININFGKNFFLSKKNKIIMIISTSCHSIHWNINFVYIRKFDTQLNVHAKQINFYAKLTIEIVLQFMISMIIAEFIAQIINLKL